MATVAYPHMAGMMRRQSEAAAIFQAAVELAPGFLASGGRVVAPQVVMTPAATIARGPVAPTKGKSNA